MKYILQEGWRTRTGLQSEFGFRRESTKVRSVTETSASFTIVICCNTISVNQKSRRSASDVEAYVYSCDCWNKQSVSKTSTDAFPIISIIIWGWNRPSVSWHNWNNFMKIHETGQSMRHSSAMYSVKVSPMQANLACWCWNTHVFTSLAYSRWWSNWKNLSEE